MLDDAEYNSQVEQNRRQKESPGHLRIIDSQRAARRTMNCLLQNWRMAVVHGVDRLVEVVLAYLYAMGDVWRAQEQKSLEQFVIVGARINVPVPEKVFENAPVLDVLKNGHANPWLVLMRIHIYLSSRNPSPSRAKEHRNFRKVLLQNSKF